MAGALVGNFALIAQLLTDLDLNPSPDSPVAVEVRCDCLQVIPIEQLLPRSISTGFCVLSSRGARAFRGRVRLMDWCASHGYSLSFGCPFFRLLGDGEVVLQAHAPPVPGLEE